MTTPTNKETFAAVYREELDRAVLEHPGDYAPNLHDPEKRRAFADHFSNLLARGCAVSKDGRAVKATCKRLGIKHTYTALRAYFATGTEAAS